MRRPWTKAEIAVVRKRYPSTCTKALAVDLGRTESSVYQCAYTLGLRKSQKYLTAKRKGESDRLQRSGKAHRFSKGHRPWNAGRKGWKAGGRSAETRFAPGSRPHTWVPVGTEVRDADGYLKRKVRDDAPPGQSRQNWQYVHVLHWERYRGPVPQGHVVVFKDGDKTHIRIGNLECIPRTELMRRNTVHRLPKDLARAVQLVGALNRQINARST